jgi:hypothetical protein
MVGCARYCAAEARFDRKVAKRDLRRYQRRDPDATTRLILLELSCPTSRSSGISTGWIGAWPLCVPCVDRCHRSERQEGRAASRPSITKSRAWRKAAWWFPAGRGLQVQIFTNRWAFNTGSGEGVVINEVLSTEP